MSGTLTPGAPLRLLHHLGRRRQSGDLHLTEPSGARHLVGLRQGHAVALDVDGGLDPLGEVLRQAGAIDGTQLRRSLELLARRESLTGRLLLSMGAVSEQTLEEGLRRQARLRLARLVEVRRGTWSLRSGLPAAPASARVAPIDLAAWTRRYAAEHGLPDPAVTPDPTRERPMPRPRQETGTTTARAVLGVPIDADGAAIRRAYHRLARTLHPDRHPEASPTLRADYARRFSVVSGAYRTLAR